VIVGGGVHRAEVVEGLCGASCQGGWRFAGGCLVCFGWQQNRASRGTGALGWLLVFDEQSNRIKVSWLQETTSSTWDG